MALCPLACHQQTGEKHLACCTVQRQSRAGITPHGSETRLPIARFRRYTINRRNRKWLHPNPTKVGGRGDLGPAAGQGDGLAGTRPLKLTAVQPHKAANACRGERHGSKPTGETTMPIIVTWDHVHLRSPDPEATAAWLEDILGGVIIRSPGRIDVKLGGANVFIAPVTAGDGVNSPPVTPYQGLDHSD
jgi:hypothetical protein